jgi:hypothetical protein
MNAVSTEVFPMQQLERMATAVAKSQLFGCKSVDQAMALMLLAQAEGMHPALAARDYHIINNRPALKADTMLARFQQAGGRVEWKEYTDTKCVGIFSHPQAGSVSIEWTIDRATEAGLMRNPTWKSYPRAMLRARCISEGVRTCFPGVAIGTYTVEEAQDMETIVSPPLGQDEAVRAAANALDEHERQEHYTAIDSATDMVSLATAFSAAWKHAGEANDTAARNDFKVRYDARKAALQVVA